MNSFPRKMKLKTAAQSLTPMDLSYDYYGTTDFFRMQPIMCRRMIPKDKFKVEIESFTRLTPLAVPTFGRMKLNTRAFFVPLRTIMEGANEFTSQTPYIYTEQSEGQLIDHHIIISTAPYFKNSTIVRMFTGHSTGGVDELCRIVTDNSYDFVTGTPETRYRFTNLGRYIYHLLLSLGYSINWSTSDNTQMCVLPILAYLKIYIDWYKNKQFDVDLMVEKYFRGVEIEFDQNMLLDILRVIYVNYDRDYFTSCWKNPIGPNATSAQGGAIDISDPTTNGGSISTAHVNSTVNKGTPFLGSSNSSSNLTGSLSQFALDALRSLTNFIRRNQLSGYRPIERMLARYGVKLSDAQANRSVYINSADFNIQISDVVSTADTDYASLGEQAGKGIGYGQSPSFNYETNEFGYFVVIQTLLPHIGYYDGRMREVMDLTPYDFFVPEFDNLGVQALRNDEVFANYISDSSYSAGQSYGGNPSGIFAYTPRYAHLKVGRDILTGDFRIKHLNVGLDAYHTLRKIDEPSSINPLVFDSNFCRGEHADYDRIFMQQSHVGDHFYLINHINVSAMRPMQSIVDSIHLDGGHEVTMPFEGVQMN